MTTLPPPDRDALAQSERLVSLIRSDIESAGGWLSFAQYMQRVLYEPGLGYYSGGARKFGEAGDFVTAPELTPLFGRSLAAQVAQIMQASEARIVEVGAGTGKLAADLLAALEAMQMLPQRYDILELSGDLRIRQQNTLSETVPHLLDRVCWLEVLPERFSGVVVANEVIDAMPVHLLIGKASGLFERGVSMTERELHWSDIPAVGAVEKFGKALDIQGFEEQYVTELNLAGRAWIASWAKRLDTGAVLLIDYGYPQSEYYLPTRVGGTLQCYYRHRAHDDPFLWPGLSDITAFVDFTAMAEVAYDSGLDVLGYTSQAQFLFNCGILEHLAEQGATDQADYIRAAKAVQRLTSLHEMGELFKALALGKGIAEPLVGFSSGNRLNRL